VSEPIDRSLSRTLQTIISFLRFYSKNEKSCIAANQPHDAAHHLNTRIDGSITRHERKNKYPFNFLLSCCHGSHAVVMCLFMPKFPRLSRRLISDLAFSTPQAARRTCVSARLPLLLLVPAFPSSLPSVSPYLLEEQAVISMYASLYSPKRLTRFFARGSAYLYFSES
jgi:hypothetical protein